MNSTLVIKNSHTYCKNLLVIETRYYAHAPRGDRLVGKDHRSSPTATHKEGTQRTPRASNLSHKGYHTCMLRGLQTSTQVLFIITSTSMTLISLPPYLKTIIKHHIDHTIQFFFYDSFYYTQLGCSSF